MAFDTVVKNVNDKLIEEKADAERHRVDPRLIRILDALILLTSDDEQAQSMLEEKISSMPVPKCKHEHIDSTGKCADCGTQIFAQRLTA